jgi:hypothetical protein
MKRILCAFADPFRTVDRSASYEMKRVLGAVRRLHDNCFRSSTNMLDRPINRAHHVVRCGSSEGDKYQTQDNTQKPFHDFSSSGVERLSIGSTTPPFRHFWKRNPSAKSGAARRNLGSG